MMDRQETIPPATGGVAIARRLLTNQRMIHQEASILIPLLSARNAPQRTNSAE